MANWWLSLFGRRMVTKSTHDLLCAAERGDITVVRAMLAEGADPNAVDGETGHTALTSASSNGHIEVVEALLAHGAKINTIDKTGYGCSALERAVYGSNNRVVQVLLDHGAKPNGKDGVPLHRASINGNTEAVQALLAHGANANVRDKDSGFTALLRASGNGRHDVVLALLAKGGKVNAKDKDGWTALMYASKECYVEIVRALLAKGANVDAKNNKGWTALMWASKSDGSPRNGYREVVEALLAMGAKVNATNDPFVDNRDGTVTDKKTGLMWQQEEDANGHQGPSTCAGYHDWRLPEKEELLEFRKHIEDGTLLRKTYFPTMKPVFYLTGTVRRQSFTYKSEYDYYIVDFGPGSFVNDTSWNGGTRGSLELSVRQVRRDSAVGDSR